MSRLSDRTHWDALHARTGGRAPGGGGAPRRGPFGRLVRRILGERGIERLRPYDQHLLWNVLFRRHLADYGGGRAIEIGSAPGHFITRFCETWGGTPWGVEYSDVGVAINRETFRARGFDPDHVIHADFLSEPFLEAHRGTFDMVISRGFVEHFSDVPPVIARHVDLLAPGGYLVVTVPNLRGVNRMLTLLFNRRLLPLHNLDIMRLEAFRALFMRPDLEPLHCGYYGTFTFSLFYTDEGSLMRLPLRMAQRLQPLLNLAFRLLLGDRGAESGWFSPSILFIGRRTRGAAPGGSPPAARPDRRGTGRPVLTWGRGPAAERGGREGAG